MIDHNILNKLSIFIDSILSSIPNITTFIVSAIFLVIVLLNIKKINGKVISVIWFAFIVYIIAMYYIPLGSLTDNLVEKLIYAFYFPNFAVYGFIFLCINIILFIQFILKPKSIYYNVITIVHAFIINILTILVLQIIKSSKIDIYSELTMYSIDELLVLLELVTATFTSFIILSIGYYLIDKTCNLNTGKVIEDVKENIKVLNSALVVNYNPVLKKPRLNYRNGYVNSITIEPIENNMFKSMDKGKELYEKFNKGEKLSVDDYQTLKYYLACKQG